MKIGSFDAKTGAPAATSAEGRAARSSTEKSAKAGGDDSAKVEISSAGNAIADAAGDTSFDAAKVERIAQAIRDGQFKVNPEKIADKLIANAQDLLKRYGSH